MQTIEYRDYRIDFDPPPIPDRSSDWHFAHRDYDGAPDSNDHRRGDAPSLEDAKRAIDEQIADAAP